MTGLTDAGRRWTPTLPIAVALCLLLPVGAWARSSPEPDTEMAATDGPIAMPSDPQAARSSRPTQVDERTSSAAQEPIPCPSPTPGEEPGSGPRDCLAIQALNPSAIGSGNPRVSDKFDGTDEAYDLVAAISNPVAGMHVTASIDGTTKEPIGTFTQLPGVPDTWVLPWDIPAARADGTATLLVEAFRGPEAGAQLLSSDTVTMDVQNKDPAPSMVPNPTSTDIPQVETASLSWPTQGGPLGFYRPPGGTWATVISGVLSADANSTFTAYYTTTAIGRNPTWTSCGSGSNPPPRESDGLRPFQVACVLAAEILPLDVTAVAVVPQRSVSTTTGSRVDVGSADVHRVAPFIQSADQMKISLAALPPSTATLAWPMASRRASGTGCLDVAVKVADRHDQPVQGANVDVEIRGPVDGVAFGSGASTFAVPPGFEEQDASNCAQGGISGKQALFQVADGPDAKRIESDLGSGLSGGGAGPGEWRFKVFSPTEEWGETQIFAWVDEQPRPQEAEEPLPDNEIYDSFEPLATFDLTWLEKAVSVIAIPSSDAAPVDSCDPYEILVAGGSVPLDEVNVDVHLRGPVAEFRFCDPPGGAVLRVPDAGDHGTEEAPSEDTHPPNTPQCTTQNGPACLHREGETNSDGKLIFGLSSDVSGNTTVTAWFDGEPGKDDDLNNLTGASATATTAWIGSADDAKISFTNPSNYAGLKSISDQHFRIVLSASAPYAIEGIDLELANSTGAVPLGGAERVAGSNTYAFDWDLEASLVPGGEPVEGSVPDNPYTLRAKVAGTATTVEAAIAVDRVSGGPNEVPPEGVDLTSPLNGGAIAAPGGEINVAGVATPGAEGVDLFYSVTPPGETLAWVATRCGYVDLLGTGSQPQTFDGTCTLGATHRPEQVTGLAAVTYDCNLAGCNAHPTALPTGRNPGALDSGDAIRVSPCSASPCVAVGPAESLAEVGTCQEVFVQVADESGAVDGAAIEATLEGPGDDPYFCEPSGISPQLRTDGYRGTTDEHGLVQTGVASSDASFDSIFSPVEDGVTRLTAWLDSVPNGAWDAGEPNAAAVFHWTLPGRCTVIGTPGDDDLFPSGFPSKICGLGGDDVIHGLDGLTGNDIILGGPGNDTIFGERGDDLVRGGPGNDVIFGSKGDDDLRGGRGDDEIFGDAGKDRMDGGKGNDGCAKGKDGGSKKRCERKPVAPEEEAP